MIGGLALDALWREVAAHLWQTTIVLLALLVIARTMRNAPARLLNWLWWIGFAKIFMPLALLSHLGRSIMSGLAAIPYVREAFPRVFGVLAGGAYYVLEPGIRVVATSGGAARVQPVYVVITVAWTLGAALMLIRWTRIAIGTRPRGLGRLCLLGEDLRERLESAARGSGVDPANIRVLRGDGVPAVAGVVRPRIIMPERSVTEMDSDELRAVLLHEEAHRRRHEPLRLALQKLALTVFFFYPPLWLLLKELNASAEMACDEAVMEAGTGRRTYASAIARMLGLGFEQSPVASVLGFGRISPVRARLDRLDSNRRYIAMKRHRLAILAAVLMVVLFSFIPMAPLADSQRVGTSETTLPAPPAPPAAPVEPAEPVDPANFESPPELIVNSVVLPEYPEDACTDGVEGDVILKVSVLKDGTVSNVAVEQGIDGYPELGESAVEAVRQWTFVPATANGEPIEAEILVPVAFGLDDSKPATSQTPPAMITDMCPFPEYPADALKAGAEGKVLLNVTVGEDGTVSAVSVREGIAGHPQLDEAAVRAVKGWRFKPAECDGVPVEMGVVVPVEFRLDKSKAKK